MERFQIAAMVKDVRESLSVTKVFGEPIERDGLTVIPVATVGGGGAGGGGGTEVEGGSGGAFGMGAKPAGVYVIKDGTVRWQPAIDANKVIGVIALLLVRVVLRRRRKRAPD